jgi:hypothetical protein
MTGIVADGVRVGTVGSRLGVADEVSVGPGVVVFVGISVAGSSEAVGLAVGELLPTGMGVMVAVAEGSSVGVAVSGGMGVGEAVVVFVGTTIVSVTVGTTTGSVGVGSNASVWNPGPVSHEGWTSRSGFSSSVAHLTLTVSGSPSNARLT